MGRTLQRTKFIDSGRSTPAAQDWAKPPEGGATPHEELRKPGTPNVLSRDLLIEDLRLSLLLSDTGRRCRCLSGPAGCGKVRVGFLGAFRWGR